MSHKERFSLLCRILTFVQTFLYLSVLPIDGSGILLTQSELQAQYGQESTTFNDGQSCHRVCDGEIKTCHYDFSVQLYEAMSGLCGECENGTISDCFKNGCITANGMPRTVMTVNRKIPGSIISCCKNDRIIVDVTNNMVGQELTVHWHGIHQRDSPWFDGVPMVTQCPIFSGNSFRYIFNASEAGTHLYHAHSGLHRMNGLFGPLIVRETNDPNADLYDNDLNEHSIMLFDWNNVMAEASAPGSKRIQQYPDSFLINGFGNYFSNKTNGFLYTPMAVFYVERGKRHRFRIANIGGHFCPFEFTINDLNMTVIATDGFPIEPIVVERIVALHGERYDVVLSANIDANINETLITLRGLNSCRLRGKTQEFARIIFVDDLSNYLPKPEDARPMEKRPVYEAQDVPKITVNDPNLDCRDANHYCIAALQQKQQTNLVQQNLRNEKAKNITLNFEITYVLNRPESYIAVADAAMVSMINKISFKHPPVPGLSQDDSHVPYCDVQNLPAYSDKDAVTGGPVYYCPHLIQLELAEVYDISFIDDKLSDVGISHSLHLHGHAFQVIDMGTREEYESGRTAFANATHLPVIKDTVTMRWKSFVKIRFRATNPGYWLFHCHLEFHHKVGMVVIFKVGNRTDFKPPPIDFPKCGNFLSPVYGV